MVKQLSDRCLSLSSSRERKIKIVICLILKVNGNDLQTFNLFYAGSLAIFKNVDNTSRVNFLF